MWATLSPHSQLHFPNLHHQPNSFDWPLIALVGTNCCQPSQSRSLKLSSPVRLGTLPRTPPQVAARIGMEPNLQYFCTWPHAAGTANMNNLHAWPDLICPPTLPLTLYSKPLPINAIPCYAFSMSFDLPPTSLSYFICFEKSNGLQRPAAWLWAGL